MPEISIIVPVYNVKNYLKQCVNSLRNQSFQDIEIILVDDGSTDGSGVLCDELEKEDTRIITLHKKNGGLSSARNTGISKAKGKYIGFVDSDDWVHEDMYKTLYDLIKTYNADYSSIKMKITKNRNFLPEYIEEQINVVNQKQLFEKYFRITSDDINYCVCDKLFKRELIVNNQFWEGKRFEDIDYNYKINRMVQKAVFSNKIMYYYYYNIEGITRGALKACDMDFLEVWENVYQQCKKEFPQYESYAEYNYKRAFFGLLGKYAKFGVEKDYFCWKEDKAFLLKNLRQNYVYLMKSRLPFTRKVAMTLMYINPDFVKFLLKKAGRN